MTRARVFEPTTREEANALLDAVRDGSALVPTRLVELALRLTGDLPADNHREPRAAEEATA